jgi:hypothetical protein
MKNRLSFLAGGFGAMVILWLLLGAAAPAPIQRNQFTTNIVGALVKGNVGFDSAVNVTGALNVGDVSFFTNTVNIGNWSFAADGTGSNPIFVVLPNGDFQNDAFAFFDDGHATFGNAIFTVGGLFTVNAVTINSIGSGLIVGASGGSITNILAGSVKEMQVAGCVYMGYPSNNTVWIRFLNSGVVAKDPGPGVFKVLVTKF